LSTEVKKTLNNLWASVRSFTPRDMLPGRSRQRRWVLFYALGLLVLAPVLFITSVKSVRNALDVAHFEFENRGTSRIIWQIRHSFTLAAIYCPIKGAPVGVEDLDKCLTHLEAAYSQFDSGVIGFDSYGTLRGSISGLADQAERILSVPESALEMEVAEFKKRWDAADQVLTHLGQIEASHWLNSAIHHQDLKRKLDQLSFVQLVLLTLFAALNVALLALLLRTMRANEKVLAAQREIEAQRAVLAHSSKLSALGEMAGGIAHEINNPLTVINGRIQILATLADTGEISQAFLLESCEKISRNVQRITSIIRSLRNMARHGPGDPLQTVEVEPLLGETLDLCRERFRIRGIELSVRNEAGDARAQCRPNEVGQILLNVLNNAFDAVADLPEDRKWVEVRVEGNATNVVFRVTDAGGGIPTQTLARIFEPFFTTKGFSKGTGLGMSISRSLAESQGGRFYVNTSHPNTQFVLELIRAR
jgi:signal transduction histidine kinase